MEKWEFGVIEFGNKPELCKRFWFVIDDLTKAGCIVDIWLNDISKVLEEFGYRVDIYKPEDKAKGQK